MANVVRIPQSQMYPLPEDYADLTHDGKRQARTNACRLWMLPETNRGKRATNFVNSLQFFDQYYLHPDHPSDFDPLFYDCSPLPTPPHHRMIYRRWATSRRTITIAPRGSAKTMASLKPTLLRALTRPAWSTIFATSTHDLSQLRGNMLKTQFKENHRILEDFSPDFPSGRIAPKRGDRRFGSEFMELTNGAWIQFISAEGRQRGQRPMRYILDDPEYDPRASTSMAVLRNNMENLLFRVVLPMVTRSNTGIDWLATFVSKQHYAWHAMSVKETPDGPVPEDPRFRAWDRMIVRVCYQDADGEWKSCWPEMWPLTVDDRLELAQTNPDMAEAMSLEEIREELGESVWLSEYMAQPGDAGDFHFGELSQDMHGYWMEGVDEHVDTAPRESNTMICWYRQSSGKEPELMKMRLRDFLLKYKTFITADTSYTAGTHSDYKACMLMAVDTNNDLFVMDCWAEQCHEDKLVHAIFKMADRWKCRSVHPEVVRQSISLYTSLLNIVETRAKEMFDVEHLPGIHKLRPGPARKEDKINALGFRFRLGKLKVPLFRRNSNPWKMLYNQIDEFNPDAKDGGLKNDDLIDCLAMSNYVLRGRLREGPAPVKEETDPISLIKAGKGVDKEGTNLAMGIDWSTVPADDVAEIMESAWHPKTTQNKI